MSHFIIWTYTIIKKHKKGYKNSKPKISASTGIMNLSRHLIRILYKTSTAIFEIYFKNKLLRMIETKQ